MSAPGLARLVDRRTGIVREVATPPLPEGMPPGLAFATAELADLARLGAGGGNPATSGCGFEGLAAARAAAVAEAAERYCGALVPAGLPRASAEELAARGAAHVDPAALALYADDQYDAAGFPFVPFPRDLPVRWTRGTRAASGEPVLVPAAVVHLAWGLGPTAGEPRTNLPVDAGIAAGSTPSMAAAAALLEVVERDAVSRAWVGGAPLPPVRVPVGLAAAAAGRGGALRTTFHAVPCRVGLPVLAAVVRDPEAGTATMGTACRADPCEAAGKALAEAVVLQVAARQLADPEAPPYRPGGPGSGVLKPWRAARDYRAAYRPDLTDAVDVLCHLQLFLDPAVQRDLEDRLDGGPAVDLDALRPAGRSGDPAATLAAAGYDPVLVDLTTADVAACGLRVVRAVVPGLRATGPAAFPFLGGDALAPADRCRLPLPHA